MFNDNRVDQDLRQYESEHERSELNFIHNYQENLGEIVSETKRLIQKASELISKGYVESTEEDVLIFICASTNFYNLDLDVIPDSFKREIFEGVCRDSGRDCDLYINDLLAAV